MPKDNWPVGSMELNPARLPSPPMRLASPRGRSLVSFTQGTLNAASASLTGGGEAFNSWETDSALWNQVMANQCQ